MTPDDIALNLTNILNTLNNVNVKGEQNMNYLLGCMQLLRKLIPEVQKLEVPQNEEN